MFMDIELFPLLYPRGIAITLFKFDGYGRHFSVLFVYQNIGAFVGVTFCLIVNIVSNEVLLVIIIKVAWPYLLVQFQSSDKLSIKRSLSSKTRCFKYYLL